LAAANLNIHLHCLVLDGVYRCGGDGVPAFVDVDAPTDDELHALLQTVITRLMKMLTRRGVLIEEMGQTYLAEPDDGEEARTLWPLQAAAWRQLELPTRSSPTTVRRSRRKRDARHNSAGLHLVGPSSAFRPTGLTECPEREDSRRGQLGVHGILGMPRALSS
jgi:hypothetical protein